MTPRKSWFAHFGNHADEWSDDDSLSEDKQEHQYIPTDTIGSPFPETPKPRTTIMYFAGLRNSEF
jgi:hypothetical protein